VDDDMEQERLQEYVNNMLFWGVIFSVAWLFGAGSVVAFYWGVKSGRIIWRSKGRIRGAPRAAWCILVGGLGTLPMFHVISQVIQRAVS